MEKLIHLFLNADVYLIDIIHDFGPFSYLIVFAVIFAETGLVVTPFLPGDSLLFAVGAIAAKGGFNIFIIYPLLFLAAVLGDAANYAFGKKIGRKAFRGKHVFNEEQLVKTEKFYEEHGPKTIIFARFLPIIRTFAPFVAGIAHMKYARFFKFNVIGGFFWVSLFLLSGFFFGNIPAVKDNFSLVILGIIVISIAPGLYAYIMSKIKKLKRRKNENRGNAD